MWAGGRTDGRTKRERETDKTKLKVAFRNIVNAPKNDTFKIFKELPQLPLLIKQSRAADYIPLYFVKNGQFGECFGQKKWVVSKLAYYAL
jgi:hypothetical protein